MMRRAWTIWAAVLAGASFPAAALAGGTVTVKVKNPGDDTTVYVGESVALEAKYNDTGGATEIPSGWKTWFSTVQGEPTGWGSGGNEKGFTFSATGPFAGKPVGVVQRV